MTEERALSPEQAYYEQDELWKEGMLGEQDHARLETLAAKIPSEARTLLDAGCGNGLFLRQLQRGPRRWERLVGADRSRAALKHVPVESVEASVDALPFSDREFDVVSCFEVLEHLPLATYRRALDELARVARRDVLICVPYAEDLKNSLSACPSCFTRFSVSYHMREYREPDLRALPLAGFACQEVFLVGPTLVLSQLGRGIHRLVTSLRPEPSLPSYAVCPTCGYQPPTADRPKVAGDAGLVARLREVAVRSLPRVRSHRWIGGWYRRA